MSAKMKTFFELKKVIDHDCGNYRMGEIDFTRYEDLREYIDQYGETGYRELSDVLIRCLSETRDALLNYRRERDDMSTLSCCE